MLPTRFAIPKPKIPQIEEVSKSLHSTTKISLSRPHAQVIQTLEFGFLALNDSKTCEVGRRSIPSPWRRPKTHGFKKWRGALQVCGAYHLAEVLYGNQIKQNNISWLVAYCYKLKKTSTPARESYRCDSTLMSKWAAQTMSYFSSADVMASYVFQGYDFFCHLALLQSHSNQPLCPLFSIKQVCGTRSDLEQSLQGAHSALFFHT